MILKKALSNENEDVRKIAEAVMRNEE